MVNLQQLKPYFFLFFFTICITTHATYLVSLSVRTIFPLHHYTSLIHRYMPGSPDRMLVTSPSAHSVEPDDSGNDYWQTFHEYSSAVGRGSKQTHQSLRWPSLQLRKGWLTWRTRRPVIGKDKWIFSQLSERLEAEERSAGRPVERPKALFLRASRILGLEMFDLTTELSFFLLWCYDPDVPRP